MFCCGVASWGASALLTSAADWAVAGAACRTPLAITPPVVTASAAATLVRLHLGRRARFIGSSPCSFGRVALGSLSETMMREADEETMGPR